MSELHLCLIEYRIDHWDDIFLKLFRYFHFLFELRVRNSTYEP